MLGFSVFTSKNPLRSVACIFCWVLVNLRWSYGCINQILWGISLPVLLIWKLKLLLFTLCIAAQTESDWMGIISKLQLSSLHWSSSYTFSVAVCLRMKLKLSLKCFEVSNKFLFKIPLKSLVFIFPLNWLAFPNRAYFLLIFHKSWIWAG